jgi:hypothetical protein
VRSPPSCPLLRNRPPDRRPAFHQVQLALAAAKKELYWANHRLDQARNRLDDLGPLSQLRRKRRKEKGSTLDRIDTFTNDVGKAEAKIACHEEAIEDLRPKLEERKRWDAEHDWPDSRLRAIDAELTNLGRPAHQALSSDTHRGDELPGETARPGSTGSPSPLHRPYLGTALNLDSETMWAP